LEQKVNIRRPICSVTSARDSGEYDSAVAVVSQSLSMNLTLKCKLDDDLCAAAADVAASFIAGHVIRPTSGLQAGPHLMDGSATRSSLRPKSSASSDNCWRDTYNCSVRWRRRLRRDHTGTERLSLHSFIYIHLYSPVIRSIHNII